MSTNPFLLSLLSLQQDGTGAISAPENWRTPPLLEVPTPIHDELDALASSMLSNGGANQVARWHFLIGSPGNGKSAGMGRLCRALIGNESCRVTNDEGVCLYDIEPGEVPYLLKVYEGDNRHCTAEIVQDASVVRNPYGANVDPAADLIETLGHAWERGISLVVCTNRGVLEKAHRDSCSAPELKHAPWAKVLSSLAHAEGESAASAPVQHEFTGRKPVFRTVACTHQFLDNSSLLVGSDTFAAVVSLTISPERWTECGACSVKALCPFLANRDWLAHAEAGPRVVDLLRRAEIYSGQVIVFREALSVLSLLLAGCPRDSTAAHPCDWVAEMVSSKNYFALASRRIYMIFYSSHSPYGLECAPGPKSEQLAGLKSLAKIAQMCSRDATASLDAVISGIGPSMDVGVSRLLSRQGVMAALDPTCGELPAAFFDDWSIESAMATAASWSLLTDLELRCINIWSELSESLDSSCDDAVNVAYRALQRWSSAHLLRMGSLLEGRSQWAADLDQFARYLGLAKIPDAARDLEQKRQVRHLDAEVADLMRVLGDSREVDSVKLSDNVTLRGGWVREALRPKTVASRDSGRMALQIEFSGRERAQLDAGMYVWLRRLLAWSLEPRCFPQALMVGAIDARIRAAARSKYSVQPDEVSLVVRTSDHDAIVLTRYGGEVDASDERI